MPRRITKRRRSSIAGGDGHVASVLAGAAEAVMSRPALVEPIGDDLPGDLDHIAAAALGAALEAISSPAFVVRVPATVLHANARGRSLLASERERVLGLLRATTPSSRGAVRFPIEAAPDHSVIVIRDLESDARSRLAAVTRRWGLTPRQSAVLAQVAQGESNRTVAGRLGCSEKTIELHVSALLAKTRCASRSRLVASFWTDLG